jgi:tRNA U34 5-carboxymethylaminomethyl modifying GTPase MnmE/TrmE
MVTKVKYGLETNLSSDLMALDILEALYHFRMITGQVTNDELLGIYFANFASESSSLITQKYNLKHVQKN